MIISFTVKRDTVTPSIQRVLDERRGRLLLGAATKVVVKEVKEHLRRLQGRGNKKGWPSARFFAGRPGSVQNFVGVAELTDTHGLVTIADPRFVHRIEGGTVTAKRSKYLAIPLTAEAYRASGKGSIRELMPGLELAVFKKGLYLVAVERKKTKKGAKGGGEGKVRLLPMFKLVRQVTHRAHPEEAPDRARVGLAAIQAMEKAADIWVAQENAKGS